jgi:hypothetical protein
MTLDEQRIDATAREAISDSLPGLPLSDDPNVLCWGFDHGDGWFEIIWQLSLAIEEELNYSWLQERWFLAKKVFFRSWNTLLYKLCPVREDKKRQEGSGTKEDLYRWVVTEKGAATFSRVWPREYFRRVVLTISILCPQNSSI